MRNYRCGNCGKLFDPEKQELCPACGAAVAPSVLTQIERKRTAMRLRAEGMTHYQEHSGDECAWKGSYGEASHRASFRTHEAQLRAGYSAHRSADVTTRGTAPVPERPAKKQKKSFQEKLHDKPGLIVLVVLIPVLFRILVSAVSAVVEWIRGFLGSYGNIFESLFP